MCMKLGNTVIYSNCNLEYELLLNVWDGDVFCFGLMNNADLITDILDAEDCYNVISCVDISDKSYNNNSTT